MTDMTLQDAIVELRLAKDTPWTASNVADGHPYPTSLAGSVATILNAVASGDLIPKADAQAAQALVVERAAEHVAAIERLAVSASIASCTCNIKTPDITFHAANCRYVLLQYIIAQCEDFRALADPSGVEELAKLRADLAAAHHRIGELEASLSGGVLTKHDSAELLSRLAAAEAKRNESERILAQMTLELEAAEAQVGALRLQLDQKDALYDSGFQAGVKLGWNFGVSGDEAGFQAATSSTEHVAELKRIRAALASAQGDSPLTDETPAQHEERTCTCGAGHGSLEGHTDWCDFIAYQSLPALASAQGVKHD